jgi:molybdopterin converting factor small subunit
MSVSVRIPTTLRTLTAGSSEVQVDGSTVGEVLTSLEAAHPGFKERLLDDDGGLRRFVNVFVADDDVRFMEGMDTPVGSGQTVSIIPAVAGGA